MGVASRVSWQDRSAGALAAGVWLQGRGLAITAPKRWDVSVMLGVVDHLPPRSFRETHDTRFHISISADEWGFYFCHRARVSWLRITDLPFVNERDDFNLLGRVPALRDLGPLVQELEEEHRITFRRTLSAIRTNLPGAEDTIRLWVAASI
ncbi:MAG: hypothetical protein ABI867_35715 [Kofleriaceae bacterium]